MTQYLTSLLTSTAGATDHKQVPILSTGTFVVPAGVTFLDCLLVGGGGGGGAGYPSTGSTMGGQGGSGGAVVRQGITVTPGETLTVTIGTGGAGAASQTSPGAGGANTTIARGATVLAAAGGGIGGVSNNGNWTDYTQGVTVLGSDRTRLSSQMPASTSWSHTYSGFKPTKFDIDGFGAPGASGQYGSSQAFTMPGKGGGVGIIYGLSMQRDAVPNTGAGGGGGCAYSGYISGTAGATGIVIIDYDQPI